MKYYSITNAKHQNNGLIMNALWNCLEILAWTFCENLNNAMVNCSLAPLFLRPFCETGDILIESAATAEMKVHFGDLIFQVLESRIHPFTASSSL
jgi:hypothetical protein